MSSIPLPTTSRQGHDGPGVPRVALPANPRAFTERERSRPHPTTWSARADGAAIVAGLLLAAAGLIVSVRAGSGEEWRARGAEGVIPSGAYRWDAPAGSGSPAGHEHRRYRPGIDPGEREPEGLCAAPEFPDFPLLREGEGQVYPQLRLSF